MLGVRSYTDGESGILPNDDYAPAMTGLQGFYLGNLVPFLLESSERAPVAEKSRRGVNDGA
jgi:hypothetical protein